MLKKLILILLIVTPTYSYAQGGLPFTSSKKIYVKGHSTLIGNNIVGTDPTEPYNGTSFNDVLELKYIDIDDDKNTFSSSQASLELKKDKPKIKYAALYWSAVYKYNNGYKKIKRLKRRKKVIKQFAYHGDDKRDLNVNTILFKTPNSNSYKTIKGSVIYDSYNVKNSFPDIKPYVCYADVTSILQNLDHVNGAYTVANIKATQGFVSGGASGGWLLYVIYEDETTIPKYFTTYNGFVDVFKKPINILFKDFKTAESGDIKTSLLLGALEGDQKFKTDHCSFLDYEQTSYIPLFNKIRPKLNFFNSTITINENFYSNRVPNSKNTLGFDLLKMEIPNSNNTIISNNMTHAQVKFNSKIDRFYLFFVAFETEISPIYLEGKTNKNSILVIEKNEDTEINRETETDEAQKKTNKLIKKIKNLNSITIPSIPKGYYLVTNVFANKNNATKWITYLKGKGYTPKSYINPKNNWTYIYLDNNTDPSVIFKKRKALSKLEDFEAIWILKINF